MMTTALALTIDDLIDYTAWQRASWLAWFRDHPETLRLSAGPHGDGRMTTVGDVVKHMFGAEQRYVQRLMGQSLSDFAEVPTDDAAALFALGDATRGSFRELLQTFPVDQWDKPREFLILSYKVTCTPKKIAMHVLMHEIRHWAQIQTMLRLEGHVSRFNDLIGSPIFGGEFSPA